MASIKHAPGRPCCEPALPPIGSKCCYGSGASAFPDGIIKVPGDFAPGYDEADCASAYFPFDDMIVEMHDWYQTTFPSDCWSANIAASYSVPNGANLPGGIGHAANDRGCQWTQEFSLNSSGCSNYALRISVLIRSDMALAARTSIFNGPAGGTDVFAVSYLLLPTTGVPFDFTAGSISIPSTSVGVPDLVVHV